MSRLRKIQFKKFGIMAIVSAIIATAILPTIVSAEETGQTIASSGNETFYEEQDYSDIVEISEYVYSLNDEQYDEFTNDPQDFIAEDPYFNELYHSLPDNEKTLFWSNMSVASTDSTSPGVGETLFGGKYFIAKTCVKNIRKSLNKNVDLTFSNHAEDRANERHISTDTVAKTITSGKKYIGKPGDTYAGNSAVFDPKTGVLITFSNGRHNYVTTIMKSSQKYVNAHYNPAKWNW